MDHCRQDRDQLASEVMAERQTLPSALITTVEMTPVDAATIPFNAGNSNGEVTAGVPDVPSPNVPLNVVPQPNTVPSALTA